MDVIEAVRQWCQEETWYVRKGKRKEKELRKIIKADTADLPVLLPTRPKCNFTMINIYNIFRIILDLIML